MVRNSTKAIVEAGIMVAIAIIFAFISAYIPVFGAFVNMIWPVPIILLGIRHGLKWSVMATVVAGVAIAIFVQPLKAMSIVLGFGLIGIVLGYGFRADYNPGKTVILGFVASVVSKIAVLGIGMAVTGINPLNFQGEMMDKALVQVIEMYRSFGVPDTTLVQVEEQMKVAVKLIPIMLPAGFVLTALLDTYLNFVVARIVLRRLGQPTRSFPPFKEWSFPRFILYVFILAMGMIYFGQQQGWEQLQQGGFNLWVLTAILLWMQGMALFYYLADKYSLSRLIRNIILVLIISNGLLAQIVIFAGAYDMAVDFRRLRAPRES